MARPCPICLNEATLEPLWGSREVMRCPLCSLAYRDPLPTPDELTRMYSHEYFFGGLDYDDYVAEQSALQRNFRRRIEVLSRYKSSGDLFEIGCAYGFFLQIASSTWHVQGIDISHEAIAYARDVLGLDVYQGDIERCPPPPGSVDIIVMWDTIEHLYDPVLAVRASAEALRPSGIIAVTTGDVDAFVPRVRRGAWRLFQPQHLYYFSRRSLIHLFNRFGLEIIHFSHEPVYRSLREMTKILIWGASIPAWRRWLQRRIRHLHFLEQVIPLNLHDIAFAIAGKPG